MPFLQRLLVSQAKRRRNRTIRCAILRPVLPDYLASGLDVILVGINPGLRSAEKGHHFAGPGNKFWDLLKDSGLTPNRLHYKEDGDLLGHGIGLTNIVPRSSSSSSDLGPEDYQAGRRSLRTKIERYHPKVAACVGNHGLQRVMARNLDKPKAQKSEVRAPPRNNRKNRTLRATKSKWPKRPLLVHRNAQLLEKTNEVHKRSERPELIFLNAEC